MNIGDQKFDTWDHWIARASRVLTTHHRYREGEDWVEPNSWRALCFDAKGRACRSGEDFRRARDEGAFPVRWIWPDQIIEFARWSIANPSFVGLPKPVTKEDVRCRVEVGGPYHGMVNMVAHACIMGTDYVSQYYADATDGEAERDQQLDDFVKQANTDFATIYAELTNQKTICNSCKITVDH